MSAKKEVCPACGGTLGKPIAKSLINHPPTCPGILRAIKKGT